VNCEEVGDKNVNLCTYIRCENIFQTRIISTILARGHKNRNQSSVEISFDSETTHFGNLDSKENKKVNQERSSL
jgi:hypothetical protein